MPAAAGRIGRIVSMQGATSDRLSMRTPQGRILAVAAIVVLVVVIALLGWRFMGKGRRGASNLPRNPSPADIAWVRQEAQQSGGDFSKLSPADQQRLTQ